MEKLETTLEEISIGEEIEEINPINNGYKDVGYKGLELMEERIHFGGTSIKYWM